MKACEIIQSQLREVGVDLQLRFIERATYEQIISRWEFDLAAVRAGSGPDPSIITATLWSKGILPRGSPVLGLNTIGYNNSRFDWLHEQALVEVDPKKRAEYYFEMQTIAVKEAPQIFLIDTVNPLAFKSEFRGLPGGAYQYESLENAWWTKGSELSPEAIKSEIDSMEKQIESLKGQFYDVSEASRQIEQAKQAFEAGDWVKAHGLAKDVMKLAKPPYALYGSVVAVVVAVVLVVLYRRKKAKNTA
jgi:hypothetical protein